VHVRLAIPVLCSVILAVHFLREQNLAFVLLSILCIPLLFVRSLWVVRGMQLFGMEWIHTTVVLVSERKTRPTPRPISPMESALNVYRSFIRKSTSKCRGILVPEKSSGTERAKLVEREGVRSTNQKGDEPWVP
jgi:hypothetical protein